MKDFFSGKKVLVTGHTGFKGAWLCLWLHSLGARVTGYALNPPTRPSLFESCRVADFVDSRIADVRDATALTRVIQEVAPEIVIHLAAQSLVRESYRSPVETFNANIMGIVNLLEAVRSCATIRVLINVTTDKVYENLELLQGYREGDPLGGYDPYASSKACSELVTSAYRSSYFHPEEFARHGVAISSARAGNVIGGGDWASERLIPDCLRALLAGTPIVLRNPAAVRPWQHVLEPLGGYLLLARRMYTVGAEFGGAWNFGPEEESTESVENIVSKLCTFWGHGDYRIDDSVHPHETTTLRLDCSKARNELGWSPKLPLDKALNLIVEWTRGYQQGADLTNLCQAQISAYEAMT